MNEMGARRCEGLVEWGEKVEVEGLVGRPNPSDPAAEEAALKCKGEGAPATAKVGIGRRIGVTVADRLSAAE